MLIKLSNIKPSPDPVRTTWDEDAMNELAQSIKENGLIVPIKVRPDNGGFEIVYGHRRAEAARRGGLDEIECIVEGLDDTDVLVQALVENIQREDMEPMDIAKAYARLQDMTGWSMLEMERRGHGKNEYISRLLALLKETPEVQGMIARVSRGRKTEDDSVGNRTVAETHVRMVRTAGVPREQRVDVLKKVADEQLTWRETRRVADAYAAAADDREREAVLKVSGKNPAFERAVKVQTGVDIEIEKRDQKRRKSVSENDAAVKQFLDMIREFRRLIESTRTAVEFGKFSPEGRAFAVRRIDALINELQSLKGELQ